MPDLAQFDGSTGIAASRWNWRDAAVLCLVCLVAVNMSGGLFAIGPMLPDLTADLRLSRSMAGLLAAIPPMMMVLFAIPGGRMADR